VKLTKSQIKEWIREDIQDFLSEADADKAKKMGLKSKGFGNWVDPKTGQHYSSRGGKLHKVDSKDTDAKEKPKPTKTTKISADPFAKDKDDTEKPDDEPTQDEPESDDVGGPAHPNVPKKEKSVSDKLFPNVDPKKIQSWGEKARNFRQSNKAVRKMLSKVGVTDKNFKEVYSKTKDEVGKSGEIAKKEHMKYEGSTLNPMLKGKRSDGSTYTYAKYDMEEAHDYGKLPDGLKDDAEAGDKKAQKFLKTLQNDKKLQQAQSNFEKSVAVRDTIEDVFHWELKNLKDEPKSIKDIAADKDEEAWADQWDDVQNDFEDAKANAAESKSGYEDGEIEKEDYLEDKKEFEKAYTKYKQFKTVGAKQGWLGESIKESKKRRYTVKEVRMWMKKLEENRYKKVYNSDARRVSWMVNHVGEGVENMPKSMKKKWTKAQYGRERYLAKEFLKSKREQMTEGKLRKIIRDLIAEAKVEIAIPLKYFDKTKKIVKNIKGQLVKHPFAKKTFGVKVDKNKYNKTIEFLIKNKINPRG
jgi:hypothetical protein